MKITRDGNKVTCTFVVSDKPSVSKSEERKAQAAGREPLAKSLYTSGGFIPSGDGLKVSINVITA